jgi:superfamily II DNA/RNA helicase
VHALPSLSRRQFWVERRRVNRGCKRRILDMTLAGTPQRHDSMSEATGSTALGAAGGTAWPAPNTDSSADSLATFASVFPNRIPEWLIQRLLDLGFANPTAVQLRALDVTLAKPGTGEQTLGLDAVVHAQTGSGKTLAYLLPAIASVDPTRACVQALVVVPTQELGMQVYKTLRRLTVAWPHPTEGLALMLDPTMVLGDNPLTEFDDDKDSSLDTDHFEGMEDHDGDDDDDDDEDMDRSADFLSSSPGVEADSGSRGFPVLPMLNQADLRRQKLQLRKTAPRIIVGNPHRIAALVQSGRLRLDLLRVLVVDEFDACLLDTSTTSALQTVMAVRGREARQTILVSATVPQHRHFLKQCVRQRWTQPNIKHIWIEESSGESTPVSLRHAYALCSARKKLSALRILFQLYGHASGTGELPLCSIVFVMSSRSVESIVSALNDALSKNGGIDTDEAVVGLWNEMPVYDRRRSMRQFRSGQARVLVATDVAARGLDIPAVSHVFHLDLPVDADAYLHRAGRAGRLGRNGMSVALVTSGEEFVIRRTANSLRIHFDRVGGNTPKR